MLWMLLYVVVRSLPKENYFNNPDILTSAPHMIFNVGNSNPIRLLDFIGMLEEKFNIRAVKIWPFKWRC